MSDEKMADAFHSALAAGLMMKLKEECERQHELAEQWENTATKLLDRAESAEAHARTWKNEAVQANAIIEAMMDAMDGKPVSEFMESFPPVRRILDHIAKVHALHQMTDEIAKRVERLEFKLLTQPGGIPVRRLGAEES